MIQRIQTIYLLLTALLIASCFMAGMNYLQVEDAAQSADAAAAPLADGLYSVWDSILLEIASAFTGLLALVCIFLYGNRPLQVRLTNLITLLIAGIGVYIGVSFLLALQAVKTEQTSVVPGLALLPLLLSIITAWLAARSIRKDEKLVRSADRLR